MLRTVCGAFVALLLLAPSQGVEAKDSEWKKLETVRYSLLTPPADNDEVRSIEDLLQDRLDREKKALNTVPRSELVRIEANYIRTTGSGEVVLHESSFHLEPRYRSFTPEGRTELSDINGEAPQPVMYFLGYARTPLALPMVSNISTLHSEEASYTVQLGILPLPKAVGNKSDSVTLYVIIQRAIESNRSESSVNIERYAKEFTIREGEPVQLKLENAPPERKAYILQLEDNSVFHFYEDFARYFTEHIWINAERLKFGLGKADLSQSSSRLSIPFTVAQASNVEVELLSVIDSLPSLHIVDTLRAPADYIAEADMKSMANGPYKYRFTARELLTDRVLFTETRDFTKRSPIMVPSPQSLANADTLQVGGKKENYAVLVKSLQTSVAIKEATIERLDKTLDVKEQERLRLEAELKAKQEASIAGLRMHWGLGYSIAGGTNLSIGIESKEPRLSFDLSFGVMGGNPVFVSTQPAENLTKTFNTPKSLGIQVSSIIAKPFDDWFQPMLAVGYYGVWSTQPKPGGIRNATLLTPTVGFNSEPWGPAGRMGFSLLGGVSFGLGTEQSAVGEFNGKVYFRF